MQELLDPADPDWAKFQAHDPDWFLHVAGEAIRVYCGWHIYPNLKVTVPNLEIGTRGTIMLPSTKVTDVSSVTLQSPGDQEDTLLEPSGYTWFENGVIEPFGFSNWSSYSGYYYGPDNWSYLPVYQHGYATVVFDSGFSEVPTVIKEIAYELTTTTTEVAAGNVKEIQTPGFRLQLMQAYGATLTADQKNRMVNYRIGGFK